MTEPAADDNGAGLLPEPVRLRALSLAADALGHIPADQLPARLRRVASFAATRRARLAGTQIAAALETDDSFRDRVATQVRVAVPDLAAALEEQRPPPAASPVEVAAVAYLLRTDDWGSLVEAARESGPGGGDGAESSEAVERLQQKLQDARGRLRTAQEKSREQVRRLKRENADLRRKLADVRRQLADAQRAARDAVDGRGAAQRQTAAAEAEARRLRARVSDLEASNSAARRSAREERDAATTRTRLLLDTLLESVQGLRRELALPPLPGSAAAEGGAGADPGTAAGGAGTATSTAAGAGKALATDDPALLEELLALPQVKVLVDGYNVTKTAWPSAPLDSQRTRLLNGLGPLVARSRANVTVVFDGADLAHPPPVAGPRGVGVKFSPAGVTADDVIRDLLGDEPAGRPVVVVSSDREVAAAASRAAARPVQSAALVRLLTRA